VICWWWRTHSEFLCFPAGLNAQGASEAVNAIVEDTTQCKFEATSPASDEVVLFNILQVHLVAAWQLLQQGTIDAWTHALPHAAAGCWSGISAHT
jgi:hypothetical protein